MCVAPLCLLPCAGLQTSAACSGPCPAGRFSGSGASACTGSLCPIGSWSSVRHACQRQVGVAAAATVAPVYASEQCTRTSSTGVCVCVSGGLCDLLPAPVLCVRAGSYCGAGMASPQGAPCSAGSAASGFSASACVPCDPGSHAPSPAMVVCVGCPPGRFAASAGSTRCTLCPALTFGATAGLATNSCSGVCSAVPGYACSPGTTAAGGTRCPAGRYSPGGSSVIECINCPAGRCVTPPPSSPSHLFIVLRVLARAA